MRDLQDLAAGCIAKAVLMDVGGTLWPNDWPVRDDDQPERVGRLMNAVPALQPKQAAALVQALREPMPSTDRQPTDNLIERVLSTARLTCPVPRDTIVSAMCLPAAGRVQPFAGARELLRSLCDQGVRIVVVSNVMWRGAAAYRDDFEDLGLSDFVTAYVTSLEVGWRKPHRRFFEAALEAAGEDPRCCVVVGDSETNDIEPAVARGIAAIRVAIEGPLPSSSAADWLCSSLDEVALALKIGPGTTAGVRRGAPAAGNRGRAALGAVRPLGEAGDEVFL